jgi:hypothetical protein
VLKCNKKALHGGAGSGIHAGLITLVI